MIRTLLSTLIEDGDMSGFALFLAGTLSGLALMLRVVGVLP